MGDFLKDTAKKSNPNLNLNDDLKSDLFIKNIVSDLNSEFTDDPLSEITIPFTSQVSSFIAQSKKECFKLENNKKSLKNDITRIEGQINQIAKVLEQTKQEEKYVMRYIDWFYDLKKELWERYSIKIDDFEIFAKVVNDFKKNDFDMPQIINECTSAISLRQQIKKNEDEIKILQDKKTELNNSVINFQDRKPS